MMTRDLEDERVLTGDVDRTLRRALEPKQEVIDRVAKYAISTPRLRFRPILAAATACVLMILLGWGVLELARGGERSGDSGEVAAASLINQGEVVIATSASGRVWVMDANRRPRESQSSQIIFIVEGERQ